MGISVSDMYLRINDYVENSAVACLQVHYIDSLSTILGELRGQVVKLIIQQGQESTDFYK